MAPGTSRTSGWLRRGRSIEARRRQHTRHRRAADETDSAAATELVHQRNGVLDRLHILAESQGELSSLGQIFLGFLAAHGRRLRADADGLTGVTDQAIDTLAGEESHLLIKADRGCPRRAG